MIGQMLVYNHNDQVMTDSRMVAEFFGKEHRNVLADIKALGCSVEFDRLNFQPTYYMDNQNRRQPMVRMTRDGFMLLAFGYTGKKAMAIKEAYIKQFNCMEAHLLQIQAARCNFRELSDAIKAAHGEPHGYHYSCEFDLINRVALGMSTKEFKRLSGIECDSIRPYLTTEQLRLVDKLQRFDSGLVLLVPQYDARKAILTDYRDKITGQPKKKEISVT